MSMMMGTIRKNKKRLSEMISTTGIEIFFVLIFFLGAWWFLYVYAGGPISWDELLYMHLSLNPEAGPAILNRYFHIYFQKAFFWMAGDPFLGAKLFWSFLISTTAALVYINARIIFGRSNYLHGLVSVLFFYSHSLILGWAGVTYADFTAMTMVTAGLTVYLVYLRSNRYRRLMLGLLGIILFFAFKSKESGIILGIIVLGLGFSGSETFNLKHLVRNAAFVLAGVVIGELFLMSLDRIFLGDALFSLRLSHIENLILFNFGKEHARYANNWPQYILQAMTAPFLLYVINIIKERDYNFKAAEKVVWLLPIGLLLFLTVSMIKGRWGVVARYYLPAVPIIAVLGAQFFETELQTTIRDLIKNVLKLLAASSLVALVFVLVNLYINAYGDKSGWDFEKFLSAVAFPIAVYVLLMLAILVKKWRFTSLTIAFACVFFITGYPIYQRATKLVDGTTAAGSRGRFVPFAAFSDDIVCSEDVSVFVSKNIYKEYKILSRGVSSSRWMFNLYFDCDLELSQFVYSGSFEDLVNNNYTYAYITVGDWEGLSYEAKEDIDAQYKIKKYEIKSDNEEGVIFLFKVGDRVPFNQMLMSYEFPVKDGVLFMASEGAVTTPAFHTTPGSYLFSWRARGSIARGEYSKLKATLLEYAEDGKVTPRKEEIIELTSEMKSYALQFEITDDADVALRLEFINDLLDIPEREDRNVWLDLVCLVKEIP